MYEICEKYFNHQVEIQPAALSHWGDWGDKTFCPDNSWAQGFQLKARIETQRTTYLRMTFRWKVTREVWMMTQLWMGSG